MEFIKYFLEFTFQSGWTFFGMILLINSLTKLMKAILSFIPNRLHFGGTQTINEIEKQYVNKKKDE
jgi:hypothetical protein